VKCEKMISGGQGLFCANFWARRSSWEPCRTIYCDGCYRADEGSEFPVRKPKDDDGQVVESEIDKSRYLFS
jgi:hypothetical protein